MYKFKYNYKVPYAEKKTTFGSVRISNIVFDPLEIEKILPEVVLSDANLKHMFAESNLSTFNRKNIYKRFIPINKLYKNLDDYIDAQIKHNYSFYSFLAEGILGLVYRDIYSFQLAKGLIDVCDTLTDQHTGVDACMYNLKERKIVLGEAKFYENLQDGLNKIIKDLTENNICNKMYSLSRTASSFYETSEIIIKNLNTNETEEITIQRFLEQDITFAGFVLHSETNINKFYNENFYDVFDISAEKLKDNINTSIPGLISNGRYDIILVHLPVKSKKELIKKIIEASQQKLDLMKVNI